MISWLASLPSQPSYCLVAGFAVGMAVGMWTDALLERRERRLASADEARKRERRRQPAPDGSRQ
jgi:hypothetical protein